MPPEIVRNNVSLELLSDVAEYIEQNLVMSDSYRIYGVGKVASTDAGATDGFYNLTT